MNLRSKPKLTYCGLTIIVDHASRFDTVNHNLCSANGGMFLQEQCLRPALNIQQCDVRLVEDKSPLENGTKCLLLLGEKCLTTWLNLKDNTLNEVRGSVYYIDGIPAIPSYHYQEAVDIKDYEHTSTDDEGNQLDSEDDTERGVDEKRRHGKTQRKNFRFWLKQDVEKAIRIVKQFNGKTPPNRIAADYIIYPNSELVIDKLTRTKNERLFFDIETDQQLGIQCFSFSFGVESNIYCIPCIDHLYNWSYTNLHLIFRALVIAIRDNILVAHNGANFDFFVLGYKYHIPIYQVEDTMLMQHRCFPETEKSLGHCISMWTYEQFHKDEGNQGYNNHEQVRKKLAYCGKDVYGMKLIYYAMLEYAAKRPGLIDSFEQVNASIKPYLITTFTGIEYEQESIDAIWLENDRLMTQYLRFIHLLVGPNTINKLKQKYKSALPSSNAQCVEYFHNMLGYQIVGKGKIKKDGTRGPSLAKKNIFRLALKYNNPVIPLSVVYRELAKESGSLKFNPWKFNETIQMHKMSSDSKGETGSKDVSAS